jgi:hypothetical protein
MPFEERFIKFLYRSAARENQTVNHTVHNESCIVKLAR